MKDVLELVFRSPWHFAGTVVLLGMVTLIASEVRGIFVYTQNVSAAVTQEGENKP